MTTRRSLMLALTGLLAGRCGDGGGGSAARIPSAADLAGTYDLVTRVVAETARTAPDLGAANVSVLANGAVAIEFSAPHIGMSGEIGPDGIALLDGTTLLGDAPLRVHTAARVRARRGFYEISGTLQGPLAQPTTFRMRRAVDADLRGEGGLYSVTTSTTSIVFDFSVSVSGSGTAGETAEIGPGGNAIAIVSGIRIVVAPSAHFLLSATYVSADGQTCPEPGPGGSCTLLLTGALPRAAESALAEITLTNDFTFQTISDHVTITRLSD